jgi:phosphomannomutase
MEIVREYDIRGIYPTEIDEEIARDFGRKIGSYSKDAVYLNYDNRIGSLKIRDAFERGVNAVGKSVIEGPLGPINAVALQSFLKRKIGISITASHNPAKYTGIISYIQGRTLRPKEFVEIEPKITKEKGTILYLDFNEEYKKFLLERIKKLEVRVGFDAMGGSATIIGREIFENAFKEVVQIRGEFDPNFFNDTPEPSEERSRKLADVVLKEKLDFGIQVDSDADRIAVVDDKGNFVNLSRIEILIGKVLHYKKLVMSVSSPKILEKYFDVILTPVGRPFLEEKLKGKMLGFEPTGHLYFVDFYPFSDGILAGLIIGLVLNKTKKKLSQLLMHVPNVMSYEDKIVVESAAEQEKKMKKIEELLSKEGKLNKLDGVRLDKGNTFLLFRKSNTEPVIRWYVSSSNEKEFEKMLNLAKSIASKV